MLPAMKARALECSRQAGSRPPGSIQSGMTGMAHQRNWCIVGVDDGLQVGQFKLVCWLVSAGRGGSSIKFDSVLASPSLPSDCSDHALIQTGRERNAHLVADAKAMASRSTIVVIVPSLIVSRRTFASWNGRRAIW